MKLKEIKQGVRSVRESMADSWQHLRESATHALTRFKPNETSQLPAKEKVDDPFYRPQAGWSMVGGEVFEDDKRFVVRLEVPGMEKEDMNIEVRDNMLVLSGEKRFTRESVDGRWRIMQCAYGSFYRTVPLSAPVQIDQTQASYKKGVLRVELPKRTPAKPKTTVIHVH